MKKTRYFFALLVLLFCLLHRPISLSAQDSSRLRISLITCGQGEEIYSTFGHTAIRVIDSTTHTDLVYNYGTFDFEAPNFIYNFVKGKLNYFVSVSTFNDFLYVYQYEKRSVWEQELLLTGEQKIKMNSFLQWNALPENKNYLYDFIADNCTTRVRDIIARNSSDSLLFDKIATPGDSSYRDGINRYSENLYWLNFGMNLLIGKRTDHKASDHRYYYLPEYLLEATEKANINGRLIAKPVSLLYEPQDKAIPEKNFFTPFVVFALLAALIILLSYINSPFSKKFLLTFDFLLFISLGLLGCLLLFMWLGTDHYWCKDNLNLLWAWPTHLLAIFSRKKTWGITYFKLAFWASLLFLISYRFLPQEFPLPVIFITVISGLRALFISRSKKADV